MAQFGWAELDRPRTKTRGDLLQERREEALRLNEKFCIKNESKNHSIRPIEKAKPEIYQQYIDKRRRAKEKARMDHGLAPTTSEVNCMYEPVLPLTYNENPRFRSQTAMRRSRHEETVKHFQDVFAKRTLARSATTPKLTEWAVDEVKTKTRRSLVDQRRQEDLVLGLKFQQRANKEKDFGYQISDDVPYYVELAHLLTPERSQTSMSTRRGLNRNHHHQRKSSQPHPLESKVQRPIVKSEAKLPSNPAFGANIQYVDYAALRKKVKPKKTKFHTDVFNHKGLNYFVAKSAKGRARLEREAFARQRLEETRALSALENQPLYSSFSPDRIFREPVYSKTIKQPTPVAYPESPASTSLQFSMSRAPSRAATCPPQRRRTSKPHYV